MGRLLLSNMPHALQPTLTTGQYEGVYNALSMVIAGMGASTVFFFLNTFWVNQNYKSAVAVSGIVTMIACYHYFRIFNSWTAAYDINCNYTATAPALGYGPAFGDIEYGKCSVLATGKPFNDAYRYMDWFLTVPLLLVELVLVMKLEDGKTMPTCFKLGVAAAIMIVLGYPGETSDKNGKRWLFWALAMIPFIYVVYTLFYGLTSASSGTPSRIQRLIKIASYTTVISWLTYPVVFVLPMLGLDLAQAEVGIQIGYSFSDIISKCGVGLLVTYIARVRSQSEEVGSQSRLINP